jgi:peptidoglycan/LPS O-acetylase OafA/YrhL
MTPRSVTEWLRSHFELTDHNRRLSSMEGLRGLAILLVFVCHYDGIIGLHLALAAPFATLNRVAGMAGGSGVDLFFLLSGFLIYRTTLRPGLKFAAFWGRRAERIYPAFLVVFACYLILGAVHFAPSRVPHGAAEGGLTILANVLFLPGMFDIPAIISAAWSLSYEWFFYLVLPIVVVGLQLRRWNRAARLAFFAVLCIGYIGACLLAPSRFPVFVNYDGSHVRLVMFVSGMIVYELLESAHFRAFFRPRIELLCAATCVVAIGLVLALLARSGDPGPADGEWLLRSPSFQVIPTFIAWTCLGLVVLRDDSRLASVFKMTWLRWTGNISYSFYLVHSIPMHVVAAVVGLRVFAHINGELLYLVALPFTIALTYAVTAILFVTVEKPLSLRPRRPAQAQLARQVA